MKIPFTKSNDGNQSPASLMAALVLVALVPAVGVLWFMSVAMRNERLAVQERLTAVYANHLASLQPRVTAWVKERQAALQAVDGKAPAEIFAAVVRAGLADGVVVHDVAGTAVYPAASNVEPVANENTERARALLAQAAELLQAGQKEEALAKLAELTGNPNLRRVTGAQGVLIVPDAQLLILKIGGPGAPRAAGDSGATERTAHRQILADLVAQLNDYSDSGLPSSQRRFLMTEVQALSPMPNFFPTLAAENLAADYLEHEPANAVAGVADPGLSAIALATAGPASAHSTGSGPAARPATTPALQRTPLAKVWRLPSADRTIVALFREERLRAELTKQLDALALPDVRVSVLAPDEAIQMDRHGALRTPRDDKAPVSPAKYATTLDAGELLPGWRLALGFRDGDPLAEASARQARFYLWMGVGVVAIIGVLAVMVARYVAAQVRLARMKNELVSTVSHELKTPLASMRVLLDTLAAGRYRDEAQMRRYVHLTTKENVRLSHLIENFLVFSRLERGQQQFVFTELLPQELVRTALDALGEKLAGPSCRLTTQLAPDLPAIRGDADALSTVMINLLDNACKYTNGEKHIEVRAYAEGEQVVFAVMDNGIGIAPEEQKRIFDRFYQVDQSLTRQRGGCGLGLSIVQSIVRAHGGVVEVESEPGRGSTFRVKIPVADVRNEPGARAGAKLKPVDHGLHG